MGTLEKLQAAGMDIEDEGQPTPEPEVVELVIEGEEAEPVVGEEAEPEIVLDDDAQTRQDGSVQMPKKKLSQLRRTRREAREQVVQKDGEIESLREQLNDLKKATLRKPQYADFATDDAYEASLLEYHALTVPQPAQQPQRQAPQQQQQAPDFSDDVNAHLDRAEKLGVDLDKFAQADSAVRTVLGDMVTDAIISSVGVGSEKALLLIGSRPAELQKVQQLLADDPSGLKVVSHLTRLAARATVRGRSVSGAPKVSRSPTGGSALMAGTAEFDKKMDKLEKAKDVQGMVELRRAARKAKRQLQGA